MEEHDVNGGMSDDDIIAAYNPQQPDASVAAEQDAENAGESAETESTSAEPQAENPVKRKKRGIERHLYPCPHCGEQILDHFTECPKCGGEVTPRGYHVDEAKRKKIVRMFQIGGAILSVGLVVLLTILLNR